MTTSLQPVATGTDIGGHSYVDWGAIIAGAIFAAAVSFLFITFGAAVGLSATSPLRGEGFAPTGVLIATGIWVIWVQVSAFMMGGYLTGRLRGRWLDASAHEVEVRDGAHGLMVWAVGALLGAYMAASSVGTAVSTGAAAVGTAVETAGTAVAGAAQSATPDNVASKIDPTGYVVDSLFRTDTPRPAAGASDAKAEVGRILAGGAADGKVSANDRAYIARVVAARTDLSPDAASKRVEQLLTEAEMTAAKAETAAREAANIARKAGVIGGFILAVSLLIAALAAWWGAAIGGRHRDEGTDFSRFTRWT